MDPAEICRRMGEQKTRAMFLELPADPMKKILRDAKLPTTRLPSHTTTRRRNEDWAAKVWRHIAERNAAPIAAAVLFEWLTRSRRPMLVDFLTGIGVQHDNGLTDADFLSATPPEKLIEMGRRLLDRFDRQEVAAYLLFLDASNKSDIFFPLDLGPLLGSPPAPASTPPAAPPGAPPDTQDTPPGAPPGVPIDG